MLKQAVKMSMNFGRVVQVKNLLAPVTTLKIQERYVLSNKHKNPKWKKLRGRKFIKVELPNYHEDTDNMSPEEARSRMKEKGLLPVRPWTEAPLFISCTGAIFEPYVPPEGDGSYSFITKAGAKQKMEFIEKKGKSMWAVRKVKSFDESFSTSSFPEIAQEIYIKAHELLAKKDEKMIQYVTEKAYPTMIHNLKNKQIVWKFVGSLEPCRVVHVRCTKMDTEDDVFAQVTCRFHTQQILAVYDRFGRLLHGSDHLVKDVLEYIVYERHLANEYGNWRIHDKIVPSWMPPKEPVLHTYITPVEEKEPEQADAIEKVVPPTKQSVDETKV